MHSTTGLPIEDVVGEVRAALAETGSLVLAAEPGAGKTTVVPLRLLAEPWLGDQKIMVLEPRRLAARAAARRMSELLGERVGTTVGYRTRTDSAVSKSTRIEVVTEGILTRQLQRDPSLAGVGLVIFDEFHERSLVGDLGLALALDCRELRPELRIAVMSATIDTDAVAKLVGGQRPSPVVAAQGRVFDVDIEWRPRNRKDRLEPAVVDAVSFALGRHEGDVLVFLAGAAQIRRVSSDLRRIVAPDVDVRPLFGGLTPDEQDAAIAPSPPGRRKVVVATDIAETSLTVDGVTVVVDAGLHRQPQYDSRSGLQRLVTVATSRASATQRAGRAGRLAPGVAIRLWSKMEQATRQPFSLPEIATADLAGFVLEVAAWGAAIEELALLDQPPERAVESARSLLRSLGAIDDGDAITKKGRAMVQVPAHPRLAAMIVDHRGGSDGWLACILAALLDERDVLQGRPDELPADIAVRAQLVAETDRSHPALHRNGRRQARSTATDLARRSKIAPSAVDLSRCGLVLAGAYPDRVAMARAAGGGKFLVRSGVGASVAGTDVLAAESFLVVAVLEGERSDGKIRMAAGIDEPSVRSLFGGEIVERSYAGWDSERNDVVARIDRTLGALRLGTSVERLRPGAEAIDALIEVVEKQGLDALRWTPKARLLQARIGLAHRVDPSFAPVDDATLHATLGEWLAPLLGEACRMTDLAKVDVGGALMHRIGWHRKPELDRLVPARVTLPNGRAAEIDYTRDQPTVRARVQDFYGSAEHPTILDGALPLVLEMLSPANRPVQTTADLAGFWGGSWNEVRKEMAGRYPKHRWPKDPLSE